MRRPILRAQRAQGNTRINLTADDYPITDDALLERGRERHQAGRLAEADAVYATVLARRPGQPDALHLRGIVALQSGRHADAALWFDQAVAADPTVAVAHLHRGLALAGLGQPALAAQAFTDALARDPALEEARLRRAYALRDAGAAAEAIGAFRDLVARRPDLADGHANLAHLLLVAGSPADAVDASRRALLLDPAHAGAWLNRGNAAQAAIDLPSAERAFVRATRLLRDRAEPLLNLGNARATGRRLEAARRAYRAAALATPDSPAQARLGPIEHALGAVEAGIDAFRRAVMLAPGDDSAWDGLMYGLALRPDGATGWHRRWTRLAEAAWPPAPALLRERAPERRLKVGYLAPDFRAHRFLSQIAPVLAARDRAAFEVIWFADGGGSDPAYHPDPADLDQRHDIAHLDDGARARVIAAASLDILVVLNGFQSRHRRLVATRLAPVQVAWPLFFAPGGLATLDYRISDRWLDPHDPPTGSEMPVRLDGGFTCYATPPDAPIPESPVGDRAIRFGSFNQLAKITPAALALWREILDRLPGATLAIKAPELAHGETAARFQATLRETGLGDDRVALMPPVPSVDEHLAAIAATDIVLDPFPFGGGFTTVDALWMGVPVVTLSGDTLPSRFSASTLGRIGLDEMVAASPDAYGATAIAIARDRPRRRELRQGLRLRLRRSGLFDAARHARELEGAFRWMWRRWCG
jgi:predicted O-linked N-acetylglucosamine transferase (SPINDLY family)